MPVILMGWKPMPLLQSKLISRTNRAAKVFASFVTMSTEVRTSNQSRASTKIVLAFVALVAVAWFGKWLYTRQALANKVFPPLAPGVVNLVGVDTQKGNYRIIVANEVAQLVQSNNTDFKADDTQNESDDSGAQKKRIPVREMLRAISGEPAAVDRFVRVLNDMRDDDLPSVPVYWSAADIKKAVDGDPVLKDKLEKDLNTRLDGTPLPTFRPSTFQRGIVIKLPVTLQAPTVSGRMPVTGEVQFPYKSLLMASLEKRVEEEPNLTATSLAGFYGEVAKRYVDDPARREKVGEVLKDTISEGNVQKLSRLPQQVMDSVTVLTNETQITKATYSSEDAPGGKLFNMRIDLTNEGRDRLWKFSRDNLNTQILLVVNGIPIAAPRIKTELAQTNLTISNLPDETLVREATDLINKAKGNTK